MFRFINIWGIKWPIFDCFSSKILPKIQPPSHTHLRGIIELILDTSIKIKNVSVDDVVHPVYVLLQTALNDGDWFFRYGMNDIYYKDLTKLSLLLLICVYSTLSLWVYRIKFKQNYLLPRDSQDETRTEVVLLFFL